MVNQGQGRSPPSSVLYGLRTKCFARGPCNRYSSVFNIKRISSQVLNPMISLRTVEAIRLGRCRIFYNAIRPRVSICATQTTCQCNLRHFSKKRTRSRSQYGRRGTKGTFRTDWEPLDMLKPVAAKHAKPATFVELLGWKPIVFMLIAPIAAWGITYAPVAPDVREKMIRDIGLILNKEEASGTVTLSGKRNEYVASGGGEDHAPNF